MENGVKIISDKLNKLQKSLGALAKSKVLVGVPSKTANRKGDPINNAAIGYLQENGAPEQNLPARPFLVPGVRGAQKEISAALRSATTYALIGDTQGFKEGLNAAGLIGQSAVQKKITDGDPSWAPLSERTLAERRRKGHTSEKPLIDTGQLRRSITYILRGE